MAVGGVSRDLSSAIAPIPALGRIVMPEIDRPVPFNAGGFTITVLWSRQWRGIGDNVAGERVTNVHRLRPGRGLGKPQPRATDRGRSAAWADHNQMSRLAVHIRRAGNLGSSTLRALSTPVTGRPAGLSNPTCTRTPAWSQ